MKGRLPAAILLLLFLFLLILISVRLGARLTDLQFFQLQSKLLYVILSSLALGALLMFVLMSFSLRFPPKTKEEKRPAFRLTPATRDAENALHLGEEDRAKELLLGVPSGDPDYWYARKMLAESALEKDDRVAAEAFYEESLQAAVEEQKAWVLVGLADYYEQQQLWDRAHQMYDEALRLAPHSPEPAIRLRLHFIREQDWREALRWQEYLEQHFPKTDLAVTEAATGAGIRYELAQLEYRQGSFKTAQALLKYVFRLTDSFVPGFLLSGEIHLKLNNPTAALRIWERGFQSTQSTALMQRIGQHFLSQNLPETAIEFFRNVLRNHPEKIRFEFCLGDLYQTLEMNDEALRVFENIKVKRPEWLVNRYRLAGLYEKLGQTRNALQEYRDAFIWKEVGSVFPWLCYNCSTAFSEYRSFCGECLQWGLIELSHDEAGDDEGMSYAQSTAWPI